MATVDNLWYGTSGPRDAEIVLVGEAWGEAESYEKKPFVGSSGTELTRILADAGIDRSKILLTNVAALRPQGNEMWRLFDGKDANTQPLRNLHPTGTLLSELQRLHSQLRAYPRRLVIGTGNYSLWALSDHAGYTTPGDAGSRRVPSGISSWRGSMSYLLPELGGGQFLPIIHPAAIMRQWGLRAVTVHDLKARVPQALADDWRPKPPPTFTTTANFADTVAILCSLLAREEEHQLVLDVETKASFVTCVGISDSPKMAISIPFVRPEGSELHAYWSFEEERTIVYYLAQLFTRPNILWVGQNLSYDIQIIREWLGVSPRMFFDTMLAHHLLFPGTPKALDYIASLYCRHYWYWKEDSKEWDTRHTGLTELLTYNCQDCVNTFEASVELQSLVERLGFGEHWKERRAVHDLALRMMWRGIAVDPKRRAAAGVLLMEQADEISHWLSEMVPQSWIDSKSKVPWYSSPTQQKILLTDVLGLKVPMHRKTGRPTLGAEGLEIVRERYPEMSSIFNALEALRSLETFNSHFVRASLEPSGRMRCSFNVAGTETFRWSSSKNIFGRGTNLQNIPEGSKGE